MSSTLFVNRVTPINADWLNDVNDNVYDAAGSTSGTVARTPQQKFADLISVKDFGVVGDGTTNDTTALQAAITAAKTVGFVLYVPPGTYSTTQLNIGGSTKHWGILGAGKKQVTFKHRTGNGTLLEDSSGTTGSYFLEGFTVDCQRSAFPTVGNHGISMTNVSGVRVRDVHIQDYKNSAILLYASTPNTYRDNQYIDVTVDGMSNAANGLLMVDVDFSGMHRCGIKGVSKSASVRSPGYGLQLKNNCRNCFISDSWAENCYVGFAFGNDTGTTGVIDSVVSGVRVKDCTLGFNGSYAVNNSISNVVIDQLSSDAVTYPAETGMLFDTSCVGNTVMNAVSKNVRAARAAVRFASTATDNHVHIAVLDNINTTGRLVEFIAGSQYNYVRLSRMTNPRVRSAGISTMASLATDSDANGWEYDEYPVGEPKTIASDAITLSNQCSTWVTLDTESSAATDNLATITFPLARDGKKITLRTANDSRDVTVKNNTGNISLAGSDCTLSTRRSTLTLMYQADDSKWIEVSRSINT